MNDGRGRAGQLAAAVAALAVVPYLSGLGNDFLTWDDSLIILAQPFLRELTAENLLRILSPVPAREEWLPLRDLTLLLNFVLFGEKSVWFLWGNIVLHAGVSVSLFFLFQRLGADLLAAFLGAGLFACHAVHVESVTWLSARKDPLSALFLTLAFLIYIRFRAGKGGYLTSLALFLLALLSKASALVFPLWLLAYDFFFHRDLSLRARLLPVAPHAAVAGAHALLFAKLTALDGVIEEYPPGGLVTILCTDLPLLWDYTLQALLPLWHQAIYPVQFHTSPWSADCLFSGLALGGLGLVAFRCRDRPWVPFAASLFYGSFLPYLNLLPHGIYYAERYLYLPSIFFSLVAGKAAGHLLKRASTQRLGRLAAVGALAAVFTAHGLSAAQRNLVWADSVTFWRYQARVVPQSSAPLMNLGETYELQASPGAARAVYQEILRRHGEVPEALYRLARIARTEGDLAGARALYQRHASLAPHDPRSLNNLAEIHRALGEPEEAMALYLRLTETHPRYLLARRNLALLLEAAGRREEAMSHWGFIVRNFELLPQEELVREARSHLSASETGRPRDL